METTFEPSFGPEGTVGFSVGRGGGALATFLGLDKNFSSLVTFWVVLGGSSGLILGLWGAVAGPVTGFVAEVLPGALELTTLRAAARKHSGGLRIRA